MNSPPQPAWHNLPAETLVELLGSHAHLGLSQDEASSRLQEQGANLLPEKKPRPAWLRWLLQFHNPLIYVLLASGIVTLALSDYLDTAVIFGVVVINALIGFVQEGKAEQALQAVRALLASNAMVLRAGDRHQVDASELVPGDLVLLEAGDRVPADLRILRSRGFRIVEAALTGESVPVDKSPESVAQEAPLAERSCMAYSSTLVASGQALAIVVATGTHTEIGQIGQLVDELQTLSTPLTRKLDQFAVQATLVILAVSLATFLYGLYVAGLSTLEVFLAVVGLAVAAIPEGLPAIVSIVLAIGTRIMAANHAIVRRLPAVETLGSVTVICTDKTGTLTRNEMTAVRLVLPKRSLRVTGVGYAPDGGFHQGDLAIDPIEASDVQHLARCALLCNDARLKQAEGNQWQVLGDPTEGALLCLAHKAGLQQQQESARFPRLDAIPFDSAHSFMATLHHDHHGQHWLFLKGAPERILPLCVEASGASEFDLDYWMSQVHQAAESGERVLALAQRLISPAQASIDQDDIQEGFQLLGLVGMIDPPREEALLAVKQCQQAGIRVKMVTGDHALTAAAIGNKLGLHAPAVLSGEAIDRFTDAQLAEQLKQVDIIARASPEHKLRLVSVLQSQGHWVAMTGDGVNDAPALKAADIGIAMGGKGTDVAREASDLVLTDDNFATIARAVREGRVVFDNIKKSLLFILPTSTGEALVILLALLAGHALPVTAGQILWVNMVTAVTLSMALAFEPGEAGVMSCPPRPPSEPLITRTLASRVAFVSLLMAAMTFGLFEWELARGGSLEMARTAAVNMLAMGELAYLLSARHFTRHAFRLETFSGNPVVLLVCGLLLLLQFAFTYAPPLQALFQTQPLDAQSWSLIAALSLAMFLAVELEKWIWRATGVSRM